MILWPDGSYADEIGVDVKTTFLGHSSPEDAFGLPKPLKQI